MEQGESSVEGGGMSVPVVDPQAPLAMEKEVGGSSEVPVVDKDAPIALERARGAGPRVPGASNRGPLAIEVISQEEERKNEAFSERVRFWAGVLVALGMVALVAGLGWWWWKTGNGVFK